MERWQRLFRLDTDLFASSKYQCAEDYISCVPDYQPSRVDTFAALSWPDGSYAFPPAPLISKCLAKRKQFDITTIVVTPVRRTARWWDQLQERSSATSGRSQSPTPPAGTKRKSLLACSAPSGASLL